MHTTYIGIDPSLAHTGFVALDSTGKILKAEPFRSKPAMNWRAQVERYQQLVYTIRAAIQLCYGGPGCQVWLEDYAPGRFMKTVIPTIEFGSLLRAELAKLPQTMYEVHFVSPATIKKFVTGKGNADKLTVAVALSKRYNVDFGSDDNQWDAMGIALFAMAWDGHCTRLTQAQIKVVSDARKVAQNGKH